MNLDYGDYNDLVEKKKHILFNSAKKRLNQKQVDIVKRAYEVASHAHFEQKRKSGEPYITHPLEVATIINEWELDEQTIAGALLHDVIEDTPVTKAEIEQIFGQTISNLVDSVTKLEKINFESEEIAHAEYFRKVVLAMAQDIRVILIKLADRLHNMLTLESMKPEKRYKIALETMEIYVPIANKIGLHKVHLQLADESFKYLHPFRRKVLANAIQIAQAKRLATVEEIMQNAINSLKSNGIESNFIYRQRTIYNLYNRMKRRQQGFNRIYDIFELKIIVKNIRDCYLTLGVLHSLYQPIPGKFKDYIAIPKSNGYQSLHSTLMGPNGSPLQIHIRTQAMDEVAEKGIISHWISHQDDDEFIQANRGTTNWINNILDIQSGSFSAHDFVENLKQELTPGDIYVFSPKGKILILPKNATVLDFAYFVHTELGNHCQGAKVNQKVMKIDTKLANGDIIEIITDSSTEPQDKWLEIAVSAKAISRIKQYLKEQKYDDDVINGLQLVQSCVKMLDLEIDIDENTLQQIVDKHYPKLTTLELEHRVGSGAISPLKIARQIIGSASDEPLNINLSNCNEIKVEQDPLCIALPGDVLYAQATRYNQIILHTQTCRQNKKIGLENLILVNITNDTGQKFFCKLQALVANTPGTFTKFAAIIGEKEINIEEISQEIYTSEVALVRVTLKVESRDQLNDLVSTLDSQDFIGKINVF